MGGSTGLQVKQLSLILTQVGLISEHDTNTAAPAGLISD